jgi:hypothetical protein
MQTAIFRSLALKSDYRPSGRRFGFRAGHSGVESAQDAISTISRRWKICVNSPSKSDIESEIHGIVAVREAWITGAKARDVNGLEDIVTDDVVVVRPWFRNAG